MQLEGPTSVPWQKTLFSFIFKLKVINIKDVHMVLKEKGNQTQPNLLGSDSNRVELHITHHQNWL